MFRIARSLNYKYGNIRCFSDIVKPNPSNKKMLIKGGALGVVGGLCVSAFNFDDEVPSKALLYVGGSAAAGTNSNDTCDGKFSSDIHHYGNWYWWNSVRCDSGLCSSLQHFRINIYIF